MAHLTQTELRRAVALLAAEHGLQRLRDRLVRLNAFVSRRRVSSPETLADQLYALTSGLRKQVPATLAFHGIWNESLSEKLGEEGEKKMDELATKVNECLDEGDRIREGKEQELEAALSAYAEELAGRVGEEWTYLDMLIKAVPEIARRLREEGLPRRKETAGSPGTDPAVSTREEKDPREEPAGERESE
ncbi:MAG: hypothetical protein KatS3mg076_2828 [Candidatus Binatia bacterium]|nr:MAG: hypothetical protein KatS3mg076_2828 [Candidatus Binatia bacterium]